MNEQLNELEVAAVRIMRDLPDDATIHDYRNIMRPVDNAYRAINNAFRAMSRAENDLHDIKARLLDRVL